MLYMLLMPLQLVWTSKSLFVRTALQITLERLLVLLQMSFESRVSFENHGPTVFPTSFLAKTSVRTGIMADASAR